MRKRIILCMVSAILFFSACAKKTETPAPIEEPKPQLQQQQPAPEPIPEPQPPTWEEQYDLGLRYLSEGKYEEAIIAFTAAIEIDPKRAPAFVGRGDTYVELAKPETDLTSYDSAEKDYQTALALDNQIVEVYIKLSDIYLALDEPMNAVDILQQGYDVTGNEELLKLADEICGQIPVVWTDATFEQMIRGAIGIPEESVYVCDLDYITTLVILGNTHTLINEQSSGNSEHAAYSWRHVSSDNGELHLLYNVWCGDKFENYTEHGSIVNIDSLRFFRNLRNVTVIANHVEDISVIRELHNIKWVNFFANDISDLSLIEEINGDSKGQEQFVEIGDLLGNIR